MGRLLGNDIIALKVTGLNSLRARIKNVTTAKVAVATRGAMSYATEPLLAMMRAYCPVESGALKASLGQVVRTYRDGRIIVGMVGPRRGRFLRHKPSRYAHLAEIHRPFIRPAWMATQRNVMYRFSAELEKRLRKARVIW